VKYENFKKKGHALQDPLEQSEKIKALYCPLISSWNLIQPFYIIANICQAVKRGGTNKPVQPLRKHNNRIFSELP